MTYFYNIFYNTVTWSTNAGWSTPCLPLFLMIINNCLWPFWKKKSILDSFARELELWKPFSSYKSRHLLETLLKRYPHYGCLRRHDTIYMYPKKTHICLRHCYVSLMNVRSKNNKNVHERNWVIINIFFFHFTVYFQWIDIWLKTLTLRIVLDCISVHTTNLTTYA